MPYIPRAERPYFDAGNPGDTTGTLTYCLQQELLHFLEGIHCPPSEGFKAGVGRQITYDDLMSCVKALDGAKADFIDRILMPYERRKRGENGDVWPQSLADHLGITL